MPKWPLVNFSPVPIIIIDTGIKFTSSHLGMSGMVPNFNHLKKGNYKMTLIITHGHDDHIGVFLIF